MPSIFPIAARHWLQLPILSTTAIISSSKYSKAQRQHEKMKKLCCPYCEVPIDYFRSPPPLCNPPPRPRSHSPRARRIHQQQRACPRLHRLMAFHHRHHLVLYVPVHMWRYSMKPKQTIFNSNIWTSEKSSNALLQRTPRPRNLNFSKLRISRWGEHEMTS